MQSVSGEAPDRELVARVITRGDEASFRLLYERHTPRLLRLARNLTQGDDSDPRDLVQDTWIRAATRLSGFEWRSSLITWLSGILVNRMREIYRERARGELVELTEDIGDWPLPPDVSGRLELESAIASLPPGGRTVLVLHDVEGYTHEEIAGFLGITPGTSKSQLCRARRAVVQFFQHERKGETYVRT